MLKRCALAAVLLLAASLLGGCAADLSERAMTDMSAVEIAPPTDVPTADAFAESRERVLLYFLGEDGLVPVSREITVPGGVNCARAALVALLGGPLEGEDGFWPDLGLPLVARSFEVSGGVAIVDLPARVRTLPQETLYGMRMAIANTLTEFSGIEYVNVLVGGREEGFDLGATLPVGTLTRSASMDIYAQYDKIDTLRQGGGAFTQMTTLYLPSEDGRFVLPEVRSIDYAQMSPIEYLYTLLEELGLGTGSELASRSIPSPMLFIGDMPEIVRTEDGAYRAIEIDFEPALDEALAAAGLSRGIYLAMLTHTLMGAVPGVEGLKVHIGEEQIVSLDEMHTPDGTQITFSQVLATRDDFKPYIGAPVKVYAVDYATGKLTTEQRILPQERQGDPRVLLETLIAMWGDRSETASLTAADVLAVSVDGNDIAVNLSKNFAGALRAMNARDAKATIYAVVNTLTESTQKGSVTFFFEGEQMQEPLGGVEMRGSLSRNPGMVVN